MKPATEEDIETVERRLELRHAMVVTRYEDLKEGVNGVLMKAGRSWPLLLLGGSLAAGIAMSRNRTASAPSGWMGRIAAGLGLVATVIRVVTSSEARTVYGAYRTLRGGTGT